MDGSITKRKDGRWQGVVYIPTLTNKPIKKYVYAATRPECRRKLNDLIEQVENDGIFNVSKATFREFSKMWLETYCANLSPTTINGYDKYLSYSYPFIGEALLCKILPVHIQILINEYSKNHSKKTCENLIGVLSGVFKYAIVNRSIKTNPCKGVTLASDIEKYRYYIYNEDEFNALLDVVTGTKDEIPVILAGLCGMRISEIMGLTWNDIDFKSRVIYIRKANVHVNGQVIEKSTKTRTSYREVVAPDYVIERLSLYKNVGLVYPKEDGSAENGGNYAKRFARMLKNAGLPHTRFHDLRHFNATMMLKNGVSDKEAAARLGHSDINMTKKYQHILGNMKTKPADILNNIVKSKKYVKKYVK